MKKSDDNVMNKNVISLFWLLNGGLYKDDITRNTSESIKIDYNDIKIETNLVYNYVNF